MDKKTVKRGLVAYKGKMSGLLNYLVKLNKKID